jgi:hypothetical protein
MTAHAKRIVVAQVIYARMDGDSVDCKLSFFGLLVIRLNPNIMRVEQ